jgi:hypothetical protein
MNDEDRNRAARALMSNPVTRHLLETVQAGYLAAIVASPLPDTASREYNYVATRVIGDLTAQLEVWAKQAK